MNPIQVLKTYSPCHMLILIPFQLLLSLFLELVLLVSSAVLLPHLHHLTLSISITCSLYIDIFKSFKPVLSCYSLIPEPPPRYILDYFGLYALKTFHVLRFHPFLLFYLSPLLIQVFPKLLSTFEKKKPSNAGINNVIGHRSRFRNPLT